VLGSAVALGASGWKRTVLAELSPGVNPANLLTFKVSEYPVLQANYGSMRFSLFGFAPTGPGPTDVITITRVPGDLFYAVSAVCTHEQQIVEPYDATPETQSMICYGHNSIYDIQGQVISPAEEGQANLPKYNTAFADGLLKVEIPGLNFKINSTTLVSESEGTQRLQLSFNAKARAKYRVRFTSSLSGTSSIVPFATTNPGTVSQTLLNQSANGERNLWVEYTGGRGFFSVEMVTDEYTP
jgi:nitrite reductase/ring-hydroxylating ferredoxin subunit